MKTRVAIVDPYSSGALLARAFAARRHECIAVKSKPAIPSLFRSSFEPGNFVEIVDGRDARAAAGTLRRLGAGHVLAGSEPGVELADELAERLALDANDPTLREARRDKYLMAEAVAARGLATPARVRSESLEPLLEWVRDRGVWPVVAKPPKSVASDSVAVCRDADELERAYHAIARRRNVLGLVNETVLVQELVRGPEYVVDTVSCRGRHRAAAFWRYHGASGDGGVFYEAMELLPYAGERQAVLLAYVVRALEALGIRHGPAHSEVIWSELRGPVLIEIGARLSAGTNAVLSRACGGPCALDLTVEACLEPERFEATEHRPTLTRAALTCFLIRPPDHRLRSDLAVDEIRSLPSFESLSITRRRDGRRIVGVVNLIHPARRVLHRDRRRLRRLERRLYEPVR